MNDDGPRPARGPDGKGSAMYWKGPYDFEGGPFRTLADLAAFHRASPHTVRRWIRDGLKEPPGRRRGDPVVFGGREFASPNEGAEFHGVTGETFRNWIREGLDAPRADWRTKPREVFWAGRKWPSLNQLSKATGYNRTMLQRWLAAGHTDVPKGTRARPGRRRRRGNST